MSCAEEMSLFTTPAGKVSERPPKGTISKGHFIFQLLSLMDLDLDNWEINENTIHTPLKEPIYTPQKLICWTWKSSENQRNMKSTAHLPSLQFCWSCWLFRGLDTVLATSFWAGLGNASDTKPTDFYSASNLVSRCDTRRAANSKSTKVSIDQNTY